MGKPELRGGNTWVENLDKDRSMEHRLIQLLGRGSSLQRLVWVLKNAKMAVVPWMRLDLSRTISVEAQYGVRCSMRGGRKSRRTRIS